MACHQDDSDLADWEEAAGISAPLYDIVDTLFELQSRGFFRRQVCRPSPVPLRSKLLAGSISFSQPAAMLG